MSVEKSKSKRGVDGVEGRAELILRTLREKTHQRQKKVPTSKMGVPKGWRKVTFVMRDEHHKRLRDLSHKEEVPVKDILEAVIESFLGVG